MKKSLIEYLDTIDESSDDFDIYAFIEDTKAEFEGYDVEIWDWDDYEAAQAAESIVEWIADYTVDKTVEDIQSGTFWTNDNNTCYTVVIAKTKEA